MYRPKFFVRGTPAYYRKVVVLQSMDDVPEVLSNDVFVIHRAGIDRWVVLACPCGCGERLDVNLMTNRRPYWRLRHHRGATISLLPSLWVPEERCGSHFWIIRNRVVWAVGKTERPILQQMVAGRLRDTFSTLLRRARRR